MLEFTDPWWVMISNDKVTVSISEHCCETCTGVMDSLHQSVVSPSFLDMVSIKFTLVYAVLTCSGVQPRPPSRPSRPSRPRPWRSWQLMIAWFGDPGSPLELHQSLKKQELIEATKMVLQSSHDGDVGYNYIMHADRQTDRLWHYWPTDRQTDRQNWATISGDFSLNFFPTCFNALETWLENIGFECALPVDHSLKMAGDSDSHTCLSSHSEYPSHPTSSNDFLNGNSTKLLKIHREIYRWFSPFNLCMSTRGYLMSHLSLCKLILPTSGKLQRHVFDCTSIVKLFPNMRKPRLL